MNSEPTTHKRDLKSMIGLNLNTVLTMVVGGLIVWLGSEVRNTGASVIRLETISNERTEQFRRLEIVTTSIMPRAEIEARILEIKTDLSQQRIETSRLNLEVEKIKVMYTRMQERQP